MPTTSTAMAAFATIAARSRRQYGVIDPVLAEATLSPANLKRLRRAGLIQNRYRGVDVIAAAPPCPEQDLLAAVMAVGGTVGGAARSAAATWRLRDHWPQFPEVVVAGSRRPRIAGIVIHRNMALAPRHLTTFRHIPLTKSAVTLLGLAAVEGSQVVADCLIRGLKRRLLTVGGIDHVLRDLGRSGRDGTDRLREVKASLHLDGRPPDSVLEGRFLLLARPHGVPPFEFQFEIHDRNGRFVARVDFAWPAQMLLVEVDGWEERASPEALAAELARQNRLVALGWRVLRFPWWRVICEPAAVAAEILALLRTVQGA